MDPESALLDAKAGDAAAFEVLLGPVLDAAFRLAMVMLGGASEAEDAVQEGALRAWMKLRQFRGRRADFRPWFLSVVANECRMARRGRWWSMRQLTEAMTRVGVEDAAVTSVDLKSAVSRLPERDRLILFLYLFLDLPIVEVASILHISVSSAKTRIRRAARRLRPGLEVQEVLRHES